MGESFDAMQGPRNEERYRQATARIRIAAR
jgi:hypothetical protein